LQRAWDIEPHGYDSLEAMLREQKPDAVCISSPAELHFEQTLQCLEAGAHVLCEKPLVGDDNKTQRVLVQEAQTLCIAARGCNRLLGTQMQYATATPTILQMCGIGNIGAMRSLMFTMNTKNIKHGRSFDDVWLDLSPHPLSVLRKIAPSVHLHEETIRFVVEENHSVANFAMTFADAHEQARCDVEIRVAVDASRDVPLRRFQINENTVDYTARRNDSDEFCAYLSTEYRVLELPDFVDTLIGNFVRACRNEEELIVTGEDGTQVVDWQLRLLAGARK
jgi:predicted dehydrogenase